MHLFRRYALLLVFSLAAMPAVFAQNASSTSSDSAQDRGASANSSSSQAQQPGGLTQGEVTVQQRIRQRRDQRRAAAIHDTYGHRWESYLDTGYLRFTPGPSLQRLTYYAWESGLTRFSNERLGYTLDARGYYGTAFVGLKINGLTRPAISQYDLLIGPTYRLYMKPKFAVSGRVLAGGAYGNFSGDTNGIPLTELGLYPDGFTFAASASVIGEYNLTPNVGFKLAPEYFFTGFGSTVQASRGFTAGMVYRFGKQ